MISSIGAGIYHDWHLENTPEMNFYFKPLNEAIDNHGTSELSSIEPSSQFTSEWFTGGFRHHNIQITLDGKGHWIDSVFVQRRSENYAEIYLMVNESIRNSEIYQTGTDILHVIYRHQSLHRHAPVSVIYKGTDRGGSIITG